MVNAAVRDGGAPPPEDPIMAGFRVYLDDLSKAVHNTHGLADQLEDLQTLLEANAWVSSGAFGDHPDGQSVAAAWTDAVNERWSVDLKTLTRNTRSLRDKVAFVVANYLASEDDNKKLFEHAYDYLRDYLQEVHRNSGRSGFGRGEEEAPQPPWVQRGESPSNSEGERSGEEPHLGGMN